VLVTPKLFGWHNVGPRAGADEMDLFNLDPPAILGPGSGS